MMLSVEAKSPGWAQAIDKLVDASSHPADGDDESEYEYEYEEDEEEGLDSDEASVADYEQVETLKELHGNDDDDWSQVSEDDDRQPKIPSSKVAGEGKEASIIGQLDARLAKLKMDDAMSSTSWSVVTDAKDGSGGAGTISDMSSLATSGFVKVGAAKTPDGTASVTSNSIATTTITKTNVLVPPTSLHLPVDASAMVTCPRCTLENLPGAQTCAACEVALCSNSSEQADMDHQIALRLASIQEEGACLEQDLQALLLDGTIRPRQTKTNNVAGSNSKTTTPATPIQQVYHWADVILREVQTMAQTLQSRKVCNVVSTIEKDALIQHLVRFEQQYQGPSTTGRWQDQPEEVARLLSSSSTGGKKKRLAFGLVFRSGSSGVIPKTGQPMFGPLMIVPLEAMGYSNDNGPPYPSKQLAYMSATTRSKVQEVPDFVWLVLLDKDKLLGHDELPGTQLPVGCREREEDTFTNCTGVSFWQANGNQEIIPLMSVANANFCRPYKPRRSSASTEQKKVEDDNGQRELDAIYHDAYVKMQNAVFEAMGGYCLGKWL